MSRRPAELGRSERALESLERRGPAGASERREPALGVAGVARRGACERARERGRRRVERDGERVADERRLGEERRERRGSSGVAARREHARGRESKAAMLLALRETSRERHGGLAIDLRKREQRFGAQGGCTRLRQRAKQLARARFAQIPEEARERRRRDPTRRKQRLHRLRGVGSQRDAGCFRHPARLPQRLREREQRVAISRAGERQSSGLPHEELERLVARLRSAHRTHERAAGSLVARVPRQRAHGREPFVHGPSGSARFERFGEQLERAARPRGAELVEGAQPKLGGLALQ
jgi:hypothetical protein